MDDRAIGMFDSGVGGMTVYAEITKNFPNENIIYLGDTKRFPYGNKSKETIIELSKKAIEFLISKNVKLVVIACGTATSQALKEVREIYKIPIIGIIEGTIESLKKDNRNKIGVIATTGTIKTKAWENEIVKNVENAIIISEACPLLAPMAEEGWINNEVAIFTIKEYMKPFKEKKIDKLILGCTHYPLFKELIKKELGQNVEIINTGEKLARYLKEFIKNNNLSNVLENNAKYKIYLTDTECNFIKVAKKLIKDEELINSIEKIDIQ
ncbi:MAG: glutamate racemase [Clostridia bacterium]|nr:glutamate racemase [Clostridia bacterium]